MGKLKKSIIWTVKAMLPPGGAAIAPIKSAVEFGQAMSVGLAAGFQNTLHRLTTTKSYSLDDPNAPNMRDWAVVLQHWEIDQPGQLEAAKTYYRRRRLWQTLIWLGVALMCMTSSIWFQRVVLSCSFIIIAGLTYMTSDWRLWMFRNQKFVPFFQWAFGSTTY